MIITISAVVVGNSEHYNAEVSLFAREHNKEISLQIEFELVIAAFQLNRES